MAMIVHNAVTVLEVMFFAGLAGSFLVSILAFVGDVRDWFKEE
jgi:hypothetical protein